MTSTVLVVEEEYQLRELIRAYLRREGFEVVGTPSGARGIMLFHDLRPDLVILDLALGDIPGETVLRELRTMSNAPVVILTAKAGEDDRIRAFEIGADDYIITPFSPRELVLRVIAVLRRSSAALNGSRTASYGRGELFIDEDRMEVRVRGCTVALTRTQWSLLTALARYPGRVYSRTELTSRTRGHEYGSDDRTVDSHIRHLRQKVEDDPRRPRIVVTVLGGGYRLGLPRDEKRPAG